METLLTGVLFVLFVLVCFLIVPWVDWIVGAPVTLFLKYLGNYWTWCDKYITETFKSKRH